MPGVERAVGPGQERPDSEGAREASRRRRRWAPAWSGGWRLTGVPEGPSIHRRQGWVWGRQSTDCERRRDQNRPRARRRP